MAKKSEDQRLGSPGSITETDQGGHQTTSSTKYKGVRKRKWGKWVSEIRLPNSRERIWLGSYDTPEKAARAFDAAQFCLRGPSANFNFPDNPPEITGGRSMSPAEIQTAAAQFANSDAAVADQRTAAEEEEEFYSPSTISDEPMVQMESEVAGADSSFHISMGMSMDMGVGLNLAGGFGSGNFASEFGLYNGFNEFTEGEYYSPQPSNFDYDDDGGGSCGDSFLWNF